MIWIRPLSSTTMSAMGSLLQKHPTTVQLGMNLTMTMCSPVPRETLSSPIGGIQVAHTQRPPLDPTPTSAICQEGCLVPGVTLMPTAMWTMWAVPWGMTTVQQGEDTFEHTLFMRCTYSTLASIPELLVHFKISVWIQWFCLGQMQREWSPSAAGRNGTAADVSDYDDNNT